MDPQAADSGLEGRVPPMIQLFHVTKRYDGSIAALQDVTLTVDKGEFVYLMGPTGAGKTTLMKLIFLAEQPDEGSILVAGQNIARLRAQRVPLLRRGIGVVFQDYKLISTRTIFENVALPLQVVRTPAQEIRKRTYQMLKSVGLHHKGDAFPPQLSGGEQQRVALARALANEPRILLADEPTGNLDLETAREIIDLLKGCNARGTTILMATHNVELVRESPRRVIRLSKGQVVEG